MLPEPSFLCISIPLRYSESAMLLNRLLLGLLAVGFALASLIDLFENLPSRSNSVTIRTYYHPDQIVFKDFLKSNMKYVENKWAIETISSDAIRKSWKSVFMRWTGGLVKGSVKLHTHFRAPTPSKDSQSNEEIVVWFDFEYQPDLEFYWGSESPSTRFQAVKVIADQKIYHSVYKVVCQPGSLIPISLTVLNAHKLKFFKLSWSPSPDPSVWKSLRPQLTKVGPAINLSIPLKELDGVAPIVPVVKEFKGKVPLTRISWKDIRSYSVLVEPHSELVFEGYFKPKYESNRFVLSATSKVVVDIFASYLRSKEAYMVKRLIAVNGYSTQVEVLLNPALYYRVTVWGDLAQYNGYEFTLMAFDSNNDHASPDVRLIIPKPEEKPPVEVGMDESPIVPASAYRQKPEHNTYKLPVATGHTHFRDSNTPQAEKYMAGPDFDINVIINKFGDLDEKNVA